MTNGWCEPAGAMTFWDTPGTIYRARRCPSGRLTNQEPEFNPPARPVCGGSVLASSLLMPVFVFLSGSLYSTTLNAPLFTAVQACFYEIKQPRRSPAHMNFKLHFRSSSQGTRPAAQPDGGWQRGRVPAPPLNTAFVWSAVQIYPTLSTHSNQTPRQDAHTLNDSNQYQTIVSKHSIEPRVWQRLNSFQKNKVSCQTSETFIIADTLQIFEYSPFLKLKQTIQNILHTTTIRFEMFCCR